VYFLGDKPTIGSGAFHGFSGATAYIRSTAGGYPTVGSTLNGLTVAVGVYGLTYVVYAGSMIAPGVVLQGLPIYAPTPPTRGSDTFVGWSASVGGSTLTFPYLPSTAGNVILHAKWLVATPTRTATRTATRNTARTATRTATRNTARTATRTATRTRTRTATRTRTRTTTRTLTRTPTRTPVRTATPTP
jgi:hypothetical protein